MASSSPERPRPTTLRTGSAAGAAGSAGEPLEHLQLAADHLLHELELRDLRRPVLGDEPTVAQHRHPVGELEDLVEEVRDEEHRDALVAQGAHDVEEHADLVGVQARRRLVEHEHLGVDVDGPRDSDELLHGDRVAAEGRGRVHVETEPREHLRGPAVHGPGVDAAEPSRLTSEEHVLGDREVGAEVDLLVDRADPRGLALGRAGEPVLLAVDLEGSGVDGVDAGQRLDQRRLAGAVLAHERVHLPWQESQAHAVERLDAGEADLDAGQLDHGLHRAVGARSGSGSGGLGPRGGGSCAHDVLLTVERTGRSGWDGARSWQRPRPVTGRLSTGGRPAPASPGPA